MIIQALEDSESGPGAHQHWSLPSARRWLLERQNADGGWGDVANTAAAVAALTPASLAAVRPPHCSDKLLDSKNEPFGTYLITEELGFILVDRHEDANALSH